MLKERFPVPDGRSPDGRMPAGVVGSMLAPARCQSDTLRRGGPSGPGRTASRGSTACFVRGRSGRWEAELLPVEARLTAWVSSVPCDRTKFKVLCTCPCLLTSPTQIAEEFNLVAVL